MNLQEILDDLGNRGTIELRKDSGGSWCASLYRGGGRLEISAGTLYRAAQALLTLAKRT